MAVADTAADSNMVVTLKIEKSPLMVSYQLSYEKDVVGGVSEDVFDYSWASAVGGGSHAFEDAPDFDPTRCDRPSEGLADLLSSSTPPETRSLLKGGRVCGCTDTGWGSSHYTGTQRSDLNCNAWPAVFRPSSTLWASRHCPRLAGPLYEAYAIRDWKWDYELKVTMAWTAGDGQPKERVYLLDWAKPEARDDELDFHFKIIFSLPKFGNQPPDLHATHYLLVPKNATALDDLNDVGSELEEAWRQTSRRHKDMVVTRMTEAERLLDAKRQRSLLVPKERVDLSGRSCDKVGVSLLTWAHEVVGVDYREPSWVGKPDFCGTKAGTCTHLQPNDLLAADRQLVRENKPPSYLLEYQTLDGWSAVGPYLLSDRKLLQSTGQIAASGDKILQAATPRMASVVAWPTSQQHSTQLEVSLNSTDIAWLPAVAVGEIDDLLVHVQKPGTVTQVLAVVRNKEDYDAKFTLSMPECTLSQEAASDGAPLHQVLGPARVGESTQGKSELGSDLDSGPTLGSESESTLALGSESEALVSTGGSPLVLRASPVSKTLKGPKAEVMVLTLERLTGHSYAVYSCALSLLNSQGSVLTSRTVDVEFSAREAPVAALEKPLDSHNNVTNYRVHPGSLDALPYDTHTYLVGGWLAGYSQPPGATECNCELWNLWCYAANSQSPPFNPTPLPHFRIPPLPHFRIPPLPHFRIPPLPHFRIPLPRKRRPC
ncbi:male gamete fusion factor [Gregarina niphandrodes]|uniref:Male gamete fusion factor n=1 Tax=Gregarina niphandrodes TaxID=110365 RepID=A0A023BC74_GRENI|nr:male gamete fusion factor [Gregarina niphandrodes]EZG82121.1 male gamete fusion factor [Gregarina niphandrodes]|eukprot:XP_011129039.1 male gamete fusion factor [Gregarina niphandrodes]